MSLPLLSGGGGGGWGGWGCGGVRSGMGGGFDSGSLPVVVTFDHFSSLIKK